MLSLYEKQLNVPEDSKADLTTLPSFLYSLLEDHYYGPDEPRNITLASSSGIKKAFPLALQLAGQPLVLIGLMVPNTLVIGKTTIEIKGYILPPMVNAAIRYGKQIS